MINEKTKICCNDTPMIYLGEQNTLSDMNCVSLRRYICGVCGSILDINHYNLDDGELLELIKDEDKLKDSIILKELKEEIQND